ncbi:hypothetical protein GCM10018785_53610 [Streptomyces longispororuber]|uniref:Uncharacterized protein n=1 Tax=Streptomyces longispororuber TaxID=68230 RepID=A0A918ZZT1_9ACTN|nr:hypothetical protein [Streptomyces longispororuber]GHE78751.1 hypothetical protein GCM10018785_53610 [Streptomyces longispororuber]
MSLTSGLHSPRTPLRRFLDRELSAGPKLLRESFRAQHRTDTLLLPPPGVGTEAGTVGTAIDQRLRLAFTTTAPVDLATEAGIDLTGGIGRGAGLRMRAIGGELAARLAETAHRLSLDNRALSMDRAHDEEEDLARMLLAAAWYQVMARNPYGFTCTPLYLTALEDPDGFTLDRLLQLPNQDMVDDVVHQLYLATTGPLEALRARTRPQDCLGGPTFPGVDITADADLVVHGLLLDFKSTKHPFARGLSQQTANQLIGYLLLDTADRYRIDTLGLYLTRSGVLASWPAEEYLDLLGTCRRDLTELRTVVTELLAGCQADAIPYSQEEEQQARELLERLAPVIAAGHCATCAQPLPSSTGRPRKFCNPRCRAREQTLRRKGLLPGALTPVLPRLRTASPEPAEDWQVVSLTPRFRR